VGERKQECNVFVIPHGSKKPLLSYELIAVHTLKSFIELLVMQNQRDGEYK
jgi:hypothetical protein